MYRPNSKERNIDKSGIQKSMHESVASFWCFGQRTPKPRGFRVCSCNFHVQHLKPDFWIPLLPTFFSFELCLFNHDNFDRICLDHSVLLLSRLQILHGRLVRNQNCPVTPVQDLWAKTWLFYGISKCFLIPPCTWLVFSIDLIFELLRLIFRTFK